MRSVTKTVFIAFDDSEFATSAECAGYERQRGIEQLYLLQAHHAHISAEAVCSWFNENFYLWPRNNKATDALNNALVALNRKAGHAN